MAFSQYRRVVLTNQRETSCIALLFCYDDNARCWVWREYTTWGLGQASGGDQMGGLLDTAGPARGWVSKITCRFLDNKYRPMIQLQPRDGTAAYLWPLARGARGKGYVDWSNGPFRPGYATWEVDYVWS
jgi:hypothetical protein